MYIILFLIIVFIIFFFKIYELKKTERIHEAYDNVYVINLSETKEGKNRWKIISKHKEFKNKIIRIPGIYGKTYNYEKEIDKGIITRQWDYGKWKYDKSFFINMSSGEIGVSLSHYYLWKRLSEMEDEKSRMRYHLILEDDAIKTCGNFQNKIKFYMNKLPDDWDIFLLGYFLHQGNDGYLVNKHISRVKTFVLCHAYIIRESSAKKLLKYLPIDMPLDSWMSKHSDKINIYRHNYSVRKMTPSSIMIRQGRKEKQIENTNNW